MDPLIDPLILEFAPVLVLSPNHVIEKWNKRLCQIYGWSQPEALGKDARQLLRTVYPQPIDQIERQLQEKKEWQGELLQTKKDGSQIIITTRWVLQPDDKGGSLAILEFIDSIEDTVERNQARDDAIKYNQILLAHHNITLEMGAELDLASLLKSIMKHAQSLLNADRGGGIYLYDEGENIIRLAHGSGINQGRDGIAVRIDQGVVGRVYRSTRPLVVDDYTHWDEGIKVLIPDPPSTVMGVPLLLKGQVIGVLLLIANSHLRKFTEQDVQQAEMFAAQAAIVIRNAQLYQLAQQEIAEHKLAEEKLRAAEWFTQATTDALPTPICVLDETGAIISVNRAWREFADKNGATDPEYFMGVNYLSVCDLAHGKDSEGAGTFAEGIRKVMRREIDQYSMEYTCDSPSENRWFIANATSFKGEKWNRMVISHTNITDRKKAEEGLRESRERLSHLSYRLVESQEQERRRIARELHDEIGQTLTALTISLNGISQNALDSALIKKLENLKGLARDLISQVNALSSELRPRVLDDLGLVPGLISLINRLTSQTGIEIDFKHGPLEQKQIAPEIEITAYRIIQEALTNVVRHAAVKLAIVRIQIDQDILWIQVQDEGRGFDYSTAINSINSMGLMSMLERAEQVGGMITVQTAPGEGTNITCRLPLGEGFIERRSHARN